MELKRNDTKMLQAISVLAMVCLHLFCKDHSGLYTPLIYVGGVPLSFYFAQFSDFCVFGFAFCSGYGHMVQYDTQNWYKKRLKGLLSVLCSYWLVLITFSVVSVFIGQREIMPGSVRRFIMNASTLEITYNGAWWYMFAYIILILSSPLLLNIVKRIHPIIVLGIGFVIYCAAYYVRFSVSTDNWILLKFGPFGMTLFEYLLGAVCYQSKFFSKIYKFWCKIPQAGRCAIAIGLILAMLYGRTKIVPSLFIAPMTGFILITLFHFWKKPMYVETILLFLAKHSTNIWLTHMFFYLVLFEGLVYEAKYPLLIYMLMLTITITLSIVLQFIEKPIQRIVSKI